MEQKSMPPPGNWQAYLFYRAGDNEDVLLTKRIWVGIGGITFILGLIALTVYWYLQLYLLVYLMTVFCTFFLITLSWFFRVRNYAERFFITAEIFKILFAFTAVLATGGIMTSGGFVFIGMAGIFFALVFPNPRHVHFLLILYLSTVTLEAVLQPYVNPPLVRFSEQENHVLFVLYFLASVVTLYFFVRIYLQERIRFRRLEAEKLQALDAAKSRFFANISHEFRTPLTIIQGMTEQIQQTAGPTHGNAVRLILRNNKKLQRLVDQLLDLSHLESGNLTANMTQADVALYLKYLLESFDSLAKTKKINLRFSADPVEIMMDFDPEKMELLVGNLLENALKFSSQGGEVTLLLELLPNAPAELPPGPCLLVQVRDTGIGIPAEHLDRIFERYYQVGEWPTEGSGLGLAMVKEYVRLFDGRIGVTSQPGAGSTFSIWLPARNQAPLSEQTAAVPLAAAESQTAENRPPESLPNSGKPRLLIIEDNPDVIRYLHLFLHDDYQLITAFDGEQGIALALDRVPDVIICDIMMPKKSGLEVCRTLKTDFRTNHIPIVLMTAKNDADSRIAGLESGADAYLNKPFHRKELEVELRKLIELRETLQRKFSQNKTGALPSTPPQGLNERFLYDLRQCLEKQYSEETFGIKALCAATRVSRTQLHRKLMALTGQSASHFIRSFRLAKARELLANTRMSIAEVGYAVGYKDPRYFTRTFVQEFGMAPSGTRSGPSDVEV